MANQKSYFGQLHKGAEPSTFQNARQLGHNETDAEKKLWQFLRNHQLKGKKFRRQHAIDKYVLDFCCHESKLGIELDGRIHGTNENKFYDDERTNALNEHEIRIIRFRNEEVINEIEKVLQRIEEYL